MSKQKYSKQNTNFTMVFNNVIHDKRLSFKSIGLFSYMFSKPDNWNFTIKSIASQVKDGEASIKSAMEELKEFSYLKYTKHSDGTGTYHLYYDPNVENPNVEKAIEGKSPPINKIDIPNKKEVSNLSENDVSNAFEVIWKEHKEYRKRYGNDKHGVKSNAHKKFKAVFKAIKKEYKPTDIEVFEAIDSIVISARYKEKTQYLQNILDVETILETVGEANGK